MIGNFAGQRTTTSLVTTPSDMAMVLLRASALNASAYALAAHETACEQGDDARVGFWRDVCQDLATLRDQLDQPAREVA